MGTHKGRAVRVEVAATYASTKTITALTKANPGVATSAAHGLAEGAIGHLTAVGGMVELEDQVVSVDATATNTFNLEDINTTDFTTFSSAATMTPVATWSTLSAATSYELGSAEISQLDTTTLLDTQNQQEAGMLGIQNVTLNQFSDLQSAAAQLLIAAARAGTKVIVRMTLSNGERRVFRGTPSLPSESLSVNQIANGSISFVVKRQLLLLPAA